MKAMGYLGLLLITVTTKKAIGDSILCEICACKYFDKKMLYNVDNSFCSVQLQNETPVREAPEQGNNQPHLVVFHL